MSFFSLVVCNMIHNFHVDSDIRYRENQHFMSSFAEIAEQEQIVTQFCSCLSQCRYTSGSILEKWMLHNHNNKRDVLSVRAEALL